MNYVAVTKDAYNQLGTYLRVSSETGLCILCILVKDDREDDRNFHFSIEKVINQFYCKCPENSLIFFLNRNQSTFNQI